MTHHLYPVPYPNGKLSIMACPPSLETFKTLKAQKVTSVLSMLTEAEAKDLGMAKEEQTCANHDLLYLNHPIADMGLPQKARFGSLIQKLNVLLSTGEHLAVHCRAGIGRSGMVAAGLLVSQGETPENALQIVSDARGTEIPDTREQGAFVADFAAHWRKYPTLYR